MKKFEMVVLLILLSVCTLSSKGFSGQATTFSDPEWLTISDPAPQVKVSSWFKGDPFENFEKGKTYVVEFWATWCGPCIRAFPHLTELQKKYKDQVQFLGIGVWEDSNNEESKDERISRVASFVKEQGEKMGYTVGLEDNKWMAEKWLTPAAQRGIPCAFIVDGASKIAWIGHPAEMDKPLEEIVNASWDYQTAKEQHASVLEQAMFDQKLRKESKLAKKTGDWKKYLQMMDSYIEKNLKNPAGQSMRMQKFMTCIVDAKDRNQAYRCAAMFAAYGWENSSQLNMISWTIADDIDSEMQDLDFALWTAKRACELTNYKESMIIDTLARVYWEQGNHKNAIEWQQKAIQLADAQSKSSYQKTLDEYMGQIAIKTTN